MKSDEIKLFLKYLKITNNIVEFGSGGSTLFILNNNINKLTSVETDKNWYNKLLSNSIIRKAIEDKKLNLIYHDISCAKWWQYTKWGKITKIMKDVNVLEKWKKYSDIIYSIDNNTNLVLIDGRFRVPVLLKLYNKISNNTFVLFHDYPSRKQYYIIENFYNLVEYKNKLYVFKKKEKINEKMLQSKILEFELQID